MLDTIADKPPVRALTAAAAGTIRSFAAADAPAVAQLLMHAFQHTDDPAPAGMVTYLREVYLDAPWYDPEVAARVVVGLNGRIIGFIGVTAQTMALDGAPVRVAFTSSLAVDDRAGDPTIAARLLRDLKNGPQEAILSDRSNLVSVNLQRSLRAEVFRDYSFDWLRVLRPAGLAVDALAGRFRPARALAPLVAPFDRATLARSQQSDELRWTGPARSRAAEAFSDRDADLAEIATLVPRFLAHHPLHPDWSAAELALVLGDASRKAALGDFTARAVLSRNGDPVGLFLYHLKPGRTAHVLQILADPGREGIVLDRAIAHAAANGAVAIGGRAQPALLAPLMERRAVLLPELWTVVTSRNENLLRHFREGSAFFTGLAGENWMRLNGDRFE